MYHVADAAMCIVQKVHKRCERTERNVFENVPKAKNCRYVLKYVNVVHKKQFVLCFPTATEFASIKMVLHQSTFGLTAFVL